MDEKKTQLKGLMRVAVLLEREILKCQQEIVGDLEVSKLQGISGRVKNTLEGHGVTEVKNLLEGNLEDFQGLGETGQQEIKRALEELFM
ncbi:MAG: hypothetical protein WCG84_04640 [Candidatus Moraniibacteriota bacterium]